MASHQRQMASSAGMAWRARAKLRSARLRRRENGSSAPSQTTPMIQRASRLAARPALRLPAVRMPSLQGRSHRGLAARQPQLRLAPWQAFTPQRSPWRLVAALLHRRVHALHRQALPPGPSRSLECCSPSSRRNKRCPRRSDQRSDRRRHPCSRRCRRRCRSRSSQRNKRCPRRSDQQSDRRRHPCSRRCRQNFRSRSRQRSRSRPPYGWVARSRAGRTIRRAASASSAPTGAARRSTFRLAPWRARRRRQLVRASRMSRSLAGVAAKRRRFASSTSRHSRSRSHCHCRSRRCRHRRSRSRSRRSSRRPRCPGRSEDLRSRSTPLLRPLRPRAAAAPPPAPAAHKRQLLRSPHHRHRRLHRHLHRRHRRRHHRRQRRRCQPCQRTSCASTTSAAGATCRGACCGTTESSSASATSSSGSTGA